MNPKGIALFCIAFSLMAGYSSMAEERVAVRIVRTDGTVVEETAGLKQGRDYVEFVFPEAKIGGVDTLYVTPVFTCAPAGTDGYYVNAEGIITKMLPGREGRHSLRHRHPMPIAGCVKGKTAWMAYFPNYRFDSHVSIVCRGGQYSQVFALTPFDHKSYDGDWVIRFYKLEGEDATYAGIGRLYRKIRLAQGGLVPLKEKVKDRPLLKYAVDHPEIRIRMACKNYPNGIEHQTLENEPPLRVFVTFDKVCEIIDSLIAQGVSGAQITLVGWNIRGHDGRFPTIFPPEPELGGEERLRHLIAYAQEKGFQIVPHICTGDSYEISPDFDLGDVALLPNGKRQSQFVYAGGRMYELCYEQAYKKYVVPYCDSLARMGFRGIGYNDVYSIVAPHACTDSNHYNNPAQAAEWARKTLREMKDKLGGCASEGGYDHLSSELDFALYISMLGPNTLRFEKLRDDVVPLWQIVYNGFIYSCPFSRSVNYTIKEPEWAMKIPEYGGHPTFYFYSAHRQDNQNWMGSATCDLFSDTAGDVHNSAEAIRKGWDYLKEYGYLQYETIDDHKEVAPGVFKTIYGNGIITWCNYSDKPFTCPDGITLEPKSWRTVRPVIPDGNVLVSVCDTLLPNPGDSLWAHLDRKERFVLSAKVDAPANGRYNMTGFQVVRDGSNRFVFGREDFPDGQYMVAWRICQGVKVIQEARKLPREMRRKPVWMRITIRGDRNIRFYYATAPHDHFDADGWDSFSGVMEAALVKQKGPDGRNGAWVLPLSGKGPEGKVHKDRITPMEAEPVARIPVTGDRRFSCQGLAVQGDTAVIIHDKGWCQIYDMAGKRTLAYYKLEGNDSHCNNAVFGPSRLTEESPFPLLYISEDNGGHACLVTEIGMDSSRIVQKIYYDTDGSDYPGPVDWMVDRKNGYLYTYGGCRWRERWVKRFPLPSPDEPEVHLTADDILWSMYYDEVGIGQGGFVQDGRIYLSAGYPPYYCKLHVYDIKTKEQILCQDLRDLQYEPEGMDISDGWLYLALWHSKTCTEIYRFRL